VFYNIVEKADSKFSQSIIVSNSYDTFSFSNRVECYPQSNLTVSLAYIPTLGAALAASRIEDRFAIVLSLLGACHCLMRSLIGQAGHWTNLWNMVVFCCDIATGRVRMSQTRVAPGNGIVGRGVAQSPWIWYIGICLPYLWPCHREALQ
jgi:hypothetical protein